MREQLEQRLDELKAEYETGQNMLADLEAQQANLRKTLLRISGAIQVLEEELGKTSPGTADDMEPSEGAQDAALTIEAEETPAA
jgi:predicted nuclease with TOPRIM domain